MNVRSTDSRNAAPEGDSGAPWPVDPCIRYPSYVSFDPFIDTVRLRSLDEFLRNRIRMHVLEHEDPKFYTGPYTFDQSLAGRPGSRMIYLSRSAEPENYFDLDRTSLWTLTESAVEFAPLMSFIATLPFKTTGRMMIMYDNAAREIPAHRDHTSTEVLHEFIWFRTNLTKPFYMLDPGSGDRLFVSGHSAWFDTVNQFHGSGATEGLTFSIRVDGKFTDEFARRIPRPELNPASTPAYWAARLEQEQQI